MDIITAKNIKSQKISGGVVRLFAFRDVCFLVAFYLPTEGILVRPRIEPSRGPGPKRLASWRIADAMGTRREGMLLCWLTPVRT